MNQHDDLANALWRIYRRPDPAPLWEGGGNLPWNDPAFSERMLREHLSQAHGAASRVDDERALQVAFMLERLRLAPGSRVLDLTCGPGLYAVALAEAGCVVTGVDFGPASIAYARELADAHGVGERCEFVEMDVRQYEPVPGSFDAALFIYGQLAVFPLDDAAALLATTAQALRPGGRLCVELLDQDRVDKSNSNWWYTDDSGLWGEQPFLHLGERRWDSHSNTSVERFYTLHLESGQLDEIILCDQTYAAAEMVTLMQQAGFSHVDVLPAWDGLDLYDAEEWVVYVAGR